MRRILLKATLVLFIALSNRAQTQVEPEWINIRPSTTGLGGDYYLCVDVDECGNVWTGGYLPFWSEGSVTRFDGTKFTNWSNVDGYLPADRVYDVAFDTDGGLWVAVNGVGNGMEHGGISHFDGVVWTTYNSENTPMPYDDMRSIAVDHNNVVWATFLDVSEGIGGLVKFDGTEWTVYLPATSGLPTYDVDKIDIDASNNVWIGTGQGLAKFDGSSWTTYTTETSGLTSNIIRDVEVDETNDHLYVVTGTSIDVYDGSDWSHINSGNAPISATGLWAVDAHGDSLIITTVGGTYLTYIYDGVTWISHPEDDHTYDARIDHNGNFWTAGNAAVIKYDGTTFTTYTGKNTGLTGMFNDDIFIDSDDRAWFASNDNGGINVFDCPLWQDYNQYNAGLWPSPIDYTSSGSGITEDSEGDIWMVYSGVAGGVVQIPDGNINDPSSWFTWNNVNSGISLQFLKRAAGDHSGKVWFGYEGACSVASYDHATNEWTNYNLYSLGQITCGAGSSIRSIRVDALNNVWVCGDAGIAKYDQSTWTFYSYLNTTMEQGLIMDIAFDADGNKWVATEHGLYKFDDVEWTHYNTSNSGLIGDFVNCVLVDNSGVVWAGNYDYTFPNPGGLCSFDGVTWTQYTPDNSGIQERYIDRLALDSFGNIWVMSATHGVTIFNPGGVTGYDCMDKDYELCALSTAINEISANEVFSFGIYPNPAHSSATINFSLNKGADVSFIIYDVSGKIQKQSISKPFPSGDHRYILNLEQLSAGLYFCEIRIGNRKTTQKLVIE